MPIAMDCPNCGTNKVETVNHVWYIQGFLLFARYGSKPVVGCVDCVRSQTLTSLAISSVMGWWCFPWGLGTPFVILQNLVAVAGTADTTDLSRLLMEQGLDIDELEIDERGRSAGDLRLAKGILHTLHSMAWADGSADEREIELGAAIVVNMLGDNVVTLDEATHILSGSNPPPSAPLEDLSPDGQMVLMKAACAIAAADDVIEDSEIEALEALGRRMGLEPSITARFVDALRAVDEEQDDEVRVIAAAIIGVDPASSTADVRDAYRNATLDATQIEDAQERSDRLHQLQAAYQTMMAA